ncbi:hypothetical protein [Thermogemmatispora tikiterensis]|uniref:hypothetical protein n=1 Tax=Thermogemmatispora tikiterensis TaxID=1825093 RepID=UPI0011BD8E63|nr:hypothetical protein [Thermogemmatispora tikiterensis]
MNASMRFVVIGAVPLGALVGEVVGQTIGLCPVLGVGQPGDCFPFSGYGSPPSIAPATRASPIARASHRRPPIPPSPIRRAPANSANPSLASASSPHRRRPGQRHPCNRPQRAMLE